MINACLVFILFYFYNLLRFLYDGMPDIFVGLGAMDLQTNLVLRGKDFV
jgi:hypothetical protein